MYAAIAPWSEKENSYYLELLYAVGLNYGFELQTQWGKLTPEQQKIVLYGEEEKQTTGEKKPTFKGVIPILQRQYEGGTELVKQKLEEYLIDQPCEVCGGKRLKPEALAVKLGQYGILDFTSVSIRECRERIEKLKLSDRQTQIADLVLREVKARLQFLLDVGLDYLTLDRPAMTLSGGEAQRIRLATQIGSGLTGVLYVLDEPSIGLHQRDNGRLLKTLTKLRDLGNTLIVVEHDEETIRAANYIVDIGPGAGIHGGHIISQGSLENLLNAEKSLTGAYLSGRRVINTPTKRREGNGRVLTIKNAHRHNLQNIDVEIPLGKLVSVKTALIKPLSLTNHL
jgi:excinuclease ABC subunit A